MSAFCTNCSSKLTCGCQKRVASNGVTVCSKCVASYEETIKKQKEQQQPTNQPPTPQ